MLSPIISLLSRLLPQRLRPPAWVARQIIRQTRGAVVNGPFTGLQLTCPSWNAHAAKLVGVYEREIYPMLERLRECQGWTIINIGAADGYYAAGLARWPCVERLHAFEMDEQSRALLAANARCNHVADKIDVQGECTVPLLAGLLSHTSLPTLLFVDVEGFEDVLLDPASMPGQKDCHVLVEVHDVLCAGVGGRLESRFAATHHITHILPEPRRRAEFPFETSWTRKLKDFYIESAISDGRPGGIYWMFMEPRSGCQQAPIS